MTTTTDPLILAEYLGKPAPLQGCLECGTDAEQTVMLQTAPDGTARWDSFCASCYQHTDLGSADLADRLALRAKVKELAKAFRDNAADDERCDSMLAAEVYAGCAYRLRFVLAALEAQP